jgi:enoyl-CoA hydratase/3-hydroxyacyl-CoA dehydrogenase
MPTEVDPRLAERVRLKMFAEACMVLEEGVAGVRDIDMAMMLGGGIVPGPFGQADRAGLGATLEAMQTAVSEWGDAFTPPGILRRLVGQGRLGVESGQGFYAYPRPDEGFADAPAKLETRGSTAIIWLDSPPANSISPAMAGALEAAWEACDGTARAVILASANPALFCAGADIKSFLKLDGPGVKALLDRMHGLLRSMQRSRTVTIAAVNGLAYGGGCELAMGCDVRLAGASATFAQPEVNLGIIPGFGGTQRLPRLVGEAKALEMNLTGDAISATDAAEHGLCNRVLADHELFDAALGWARKIGDQAPLAVQHIKQVSAKGDLENGLSAEKQGFAAVFGSDDAREGITAFVEKRPPRWQGS